MFGRRFRLFKVLGFTVHADASWLVILALVIWSLTAAVFPAQAPGLTLTAYLAMGVVAALALFASVVVHELSHSLVARTQGMQMKGITLFLFGGVAEMGDEPATPKAEFLMAAAGPAASLVIGAVFLLMAMAAGAAAAPLSVVVVTRWIGIINLLLAAFNMIPGFPMDGGRVLRAGLWHWKGSLREATRIAARVGVGFGLVLIGLGFLNLLMMNPIGGLWWILIGMFVRGAAKQSYRQVVIREELRGEPVRRFMNAEPVTVGPEVSVEEFVEGFLYKHHHTMFPLVSGGRLAGCVTVDQVKHVPRASWRETTVEQIAAPCDVDVTIDPNQDAMEALARLNRKDASSRLIAVESGHVVGIVTLQDLMKFLTMKLELEPAVNGLGGKVNDKTVKDVAEGI